MTEPDPAGIKADITYLAPGSYINRRFVAPRASIEFRTVAYFP